MLAAYLDCIGLIERLHRQFLDVVKAELDARGIRDINNVQSLILFNIGDGEVTVGELTQRGYYLGSNVSYNLKKMVEAGYLEQERSVHDRRSIRVRLSPKGRKLWDQMRDMFELHATRLDEGDLRPEQMEDAAATLRDMERFWIETSISAATRSHDVANKRVA